MASDEPGEMVPSKPRRKRVMSLAGVLIVPLVVIS